MALFSYNDTRPLDDTPMAKDVLMSSHIEPPLQTPSHQQTAKKPALSAAERQRRIEAANYARASMGLEGFTLSAEAEKHLLRHINGEIDMAEFVMGHMGYRRDW